MRVALKNSSSCVKSCAQCRHFCDDPQELESLFEGILILSSAYGSTRGRAGVCAIHQRFHDPEAACEDFVDRSEPHRPEILEGANIGTETRRS